MAKKKTTKSAKKTKKIKKKKYVQVGTGGRAGMFYEAIYRDFADCAKLLAFCDLNQTRMDVTNEILKEQFDADPLPTYKPSQFDEMIKKHKPDTVIVTTMDRTHHRFIIRAMELGCNVITEKPMTVDAEKCQEILDKQKETGKDVRVTFNYRYSPFNTKIRELIMNGTIGKVHGVHFEWLLDTKHGADYFRRWHRDKRNSGGLMVHKSTHHFDLVNFWLGSQPKVVFGFGDLQFYGRENAEERGVEEFYQRAHGSELAKEDPFALHMEDKDRLRRLYLEAEHEDGYQRDQSVFGHGISIEDTMNVIVKYASGASMTYQLTAYSPWEGFVVTFTGDKGRIEAKVMEGSYVSAGGSRDDEGAHKMGDLHVYPVREDPYEVIVEKKEGGHGGGDPVMLSDIFSDNPEPDPFERAAGHVDGAMSILTGIAANKAFATGLPVKVDDLVKF